MSSVKNLYCTASERSFVGCLVHGQGAALETCAATEEHFFDALAREVFILARDLYLKGSPVNTRTVMRTFSGAGPDRIRAVSAVCFYPAPTQAAHFFEILNDKLTLRRAHETVQWAASQIEDTQSASEFCAEFQVKVSSLDSTATSENVLATVGGSIFEKIGRMERGEVVRGIPTKLSPWDNNFGGLMPGQLYAVAGRPGSGKTALLEMLIQQCLDLDVPVSVFEKDMDPQKLVERMGCRLAKVQYWRFAKGVMHDWELRNVRKGVEFVVAAPMHLYNPNRLTAERLCAIARRDIRVNGVKAVFLDHIQALRVGENLREGLTQASLSLRANVTETGVPHVVLAHINRNGAKGRPTPEDIKEFDQLYGDCDAMMILWSEQNRADLAKDEMLTTKFYTAKNREGGTIEDEMLFDGPNMTFREKAKEL